MLYNWSTSANTILHNVVQRNAPRITRWLDSRATTSSSSSLFYRQNTSIRSSQPSLRTSAFLSTPFRTNHAAAAPSVRPSEPYSTTISQRASTGNFSSMSLTSAQMSRASAQAVRLCVRDSKFGDALYLVNSLHFSVHRNRGVFKQHNAEAKSLKSRPAWPEPINLGQAVSPRLSAHAFLHGLIRAGYEKKAATYAQLMMEQGINIRPSTTQSIILSLSPSSTKPSHGTKWVNALLRPRIRNNPEVLQLDCSLITDPCTRAAVNLLQAARQWGQHRTERMYDNVISTLLMQGEIIVGSLLFVLLVKDWQLRHAVSDGAPREVGGGEEPLVSSSSTQYKVGGVYTKKTEWTPFPERYQMYVILQEIDKAVSAPPQGSDSQPNLFAPLQALANFAMLLDTGQLHIGNIAPLIRSLYSCPQTTQCVWIRNRQGRRELINAHQYFHDVLLRLIDSLYKPDPSGTRPRLDLRSYNALLFYSLRHRLSPATASRVLEHMCTRRQPSYQPNIVTYNILLRSGTLTHNMKISEIALQALKRNGLNFKIGDVVVPFTAVSVESEEAVKPSRSQPALESVLGVALRRLETEVLRAPDSVLNTSDSIRPDSYTLTSYLCHLASSGRSKVITRVVSSLIPDLRIVDPPSWKRLPLEERRKKREDIRKARLRRAVQFGPYVFAALLNALAKARNIGLAEKVWDLAKQAETASWMPEYACDSSPWCLSVHAYTSMIQCYASVARTTSSALRHKGQRGIIALREDKAGSRLRPNTYGWAYFVRATRRLYKKHAHRTKELRQTMKSLLYRSMRSGGRAVYKSLIAFQHPSLSQPSSHMTFPSPDARFFNAALDLFGRHPAMRRRATRGTLTQSIRRLQVASKWHAFRGTKSRFWTPALQEVAEDLVVAGFSVPIGLRHLFIGRWNPGTQPSGQSLQIPERRPYAFSRPPRDFRPYALDAVKTRGLPVARYPRRRYLGRQRTKCNSSSST